MSEVEIGKVTVTRTFNADGEDCIDVHTEPEGMTQVEIAGLLMFAIIKTVASDEDEEDS